MDENTTPELHKGACALGFKYVATSQGEGIKGYLDQAVAAYIVAKGFKTFMTFDKKRLDRSGGATSPKGDDLRIVFERMRLRLLEKENLALPSEQDQNLQRSLQYKMPLGILLNRNLSDEHNLACLRNNIQQLKDFIRSRDSIIDVEILSDKNLQPSRTLEDLKEEYSNAFWEQVSPDWRQETPLAAKMKKYLQRISEQRSSERHRLLNFMIAA